MDTALPASISPARLLARLARGDDLLLLDVRRSAAYAASPRVLERAVHVPPEEVAAFALRSPPREVVVYCVYGHHVSHEAVATLRNAGWEARWLEGGIEGGETGVDAEGDCALWRATQLPVVKKAQAPDVGVPVGHPDLRKPDHERPRRSGWSEAQPRQRGAAE